MVSQSDFKSKGSSDEIGKSRQWEILGSSDAASGERRRCGMTGREQFFTILVIVLGTMLTRFLPFLLFPAGKPTPKLVQKLGRILPAAVFGLLIVYCLKNVSFLSGSHGLPELISIALVTALHLWKRQTLLSIAAGTVCYMLLIQFVF